MNKLIRRLFNITTVKWVKNTEKKSSREADKYLLIIDRNSNEYLLTESALKRPDARAKRNPEDVNPQTEKHNE